MQLQFCLIFFSRFSILVYGYLIVLNVYFYGAPKIILHKYIIYNKLLWRK